MAEFKNFATPHCHVQSLDSASTPEAFAKREVELGSGALVCTDHGSLAAAQQVFQLGKESGLTPVIGLEGYFRDDNCPILKGLGIPRTATVPRGMDKDQWAADHPDGSFFDYLKYTHITLHAMDEPAYLKMVQLLSRADARAEQHGSERKPLFAWSDLEELGALNVTATSSCLVGMVQRHLIDQQNPTASRAYFDRLNHLFRGRFYVEVFPHVCSHNWVRKVFIETMDQEGKEERLTYYYGKKLRTNQNEPEGLTAEELAAQYSASRHKVLTEVKNFRKWEPLDPQRQITSVTRQEGFIQNECSKAAPGGDVQWGGNKFVMGLAQKHGVPVLVSDDSHYAYPDEKVVQDVRLAQQGDWRFYGSYHRQTSEEAWGYFRDQLQVPQAVFEEWVDNSHGWTSRFADFKFDTTPKLPTKFYSKDTLAQTLKLIKQYGRMPKDPVYMARLKEEIELLHRNGTIDLLPYFFIDEELCRVHANQGMLTGPGRGSAAGPLISYLLGITHVDPLRYGLSLERFITKDRIASGKMPDIDQDFPTRALLDGKDATVKPTTEHITGSVVECVMEDGTVHVLPESFKMETDQGLMTPAEALAAGADIKPWWLEKDIEAPIGT